MAVGGRAAPPAPAPPLLPFCQRAATLLQTPQPPLISATPPSLPPNPQNKKVAPELRERFFGAALELKSHDNYCPAWAGDAKDPASRVGGDGESVAEVAARAGALLAALEARHAGRAVLLVSHGDTLSITLTAARGGDLRRHREHGLETAELRRLLPAGAAAAQQGQGQQQQQGQQQGQQQPAQEKAEAGVPVTAVAAVAGV